MGISPAGRISDGTSHRSPEPIARRGGGIGPFVVLVGLAVLPVGLAVTLQGSTYDTWGAFIWAPVMLALAFPFCRWVAKRAGEPDIVGFLFGAAALKICVGATARYYIIDSVYGTGDSIVYDKEAALLTEPFRHGVFQDLGKITGTRFVEVLTGVVQSIIGQTMIGSFLVFSTMGFIGMGLAYLAFCEAMPGGDRTLYRRLLFLTPTLWFWPSAIGKEAFLMLCMGAALYGYARMLNGRLGGLVAGGLGVWGIVVVRPHIAIMFALAAVAAIPAWAKPTPGEARSRERSVGRFVVPMLVVLALPVILSSAETFFKVDHLNVDSAKEVREDVVERTLKGGSEFTPPDTSNPVGLAQGLATVLSRPYPWEAGGFQRLAALEGAALVAMSVVVVYHRKMALVRAMRERWPRFALVYVLAFAWGFSAVANFGILARQRSLMLPLYFVLLAAAPRPPSLPEERPGLRTRENLGARVGARFVRS